MNLIKIFKITFFYLLLTYSFIVKSEQVTMYLDMNYVLQNSQAGKSISDKLININSKNVNEFKLIEKKIEEDKKKIISQKNVIDKKKYDNLVLKIQIEIDEYKKMRQQKKNEINKKKNIATNKLIKYINQIIVNYSADNNISMIIDKRNIIIGKKELEITSEILKLVDNKVKNIDLK
tara:strand:+ start:250 stop:780 length:531 start_codon:yes stop_codon:yes gene_type:complete